MKGRCVRYLRPTSFIFFISLVIGCASSHLSGPVAMPSEYAFDDPDAGNTGIVIEHRYGGWKWVHDLTPWAWRKVKYQGCYRSIRVTLDGREVYSKNFYNFGEIMRGVNASDVSNKVLQVYKAPLDPGEHRFVLEGKQASRIPGVSKVEKIDSLNVVVEKSKVNKIIVNSNLYVQSGKVGEYDLGNSFSYCNINLKVY